MTLNPFSDVEHIHKKWLFQPHDKRAPVDSAQLTHEHACFLVNSHARSPSLNNTKSYRPLEPFQSTKILGLHPSEQLGHLSCHFVLFEPVTSLP